MKRRRRFLCLLLTFCLIINSVFGLRSTAVSVYADTTASDIAEAVTTFTDALTKLTSKTEELNKIGKILERFGGVTAAVSGGIAILELVGITEDETEAQLDEILYEVKNVQDQVKQMDAKLDDISKQLVDMAVSAEEKDRQNRAMTVLSYWRKFRTDYVDPLDKHLNEYESIMSIAIDNWWNTASLHQDTCVLYTDTEEGPDLAYSIEAGFPDTVNDSETVNKDLSFCVPKAVIDRIVSGAGTYNKETYKSRFRTNAEKQLSNAIINHQLTFASRANETAFAAAWKALDDTEKEEKAERYAQDLLNTLISRIAISAMSVSAQDTKHKSASDTNKIRDNMMNTINFLEIKRGKALTGNPNYCYIAGAPLDFQSLKVSSSITSIYEKVKGRGTDKIRVVNNSADPWKLKTTNGTETNLPSYMNDTWTYGTLSLLSAAENR